MKAIIYFILFYLSILNISGQQIGNYISNGSFEDNYNCTSTFIGDIKYWSAINSNNCYGGESFSYCNGKVPNQYNTIYQLPKTGNAFMGSTFYYPASTNYGRNYLKNILKSNLQNGVTYCVKFYVNIMNRSSYGNDGFAIYFGSNLIDTITQCSKQLSFITPQIKCISGNPINDTLGWTPVTGTFVANGTEQYAVIGIFKPNGMVDTVLISPMSLPLRFTDACIEDVSCIPLDLDAYAGPDKNCIPGDSVYIGRQPDFEIDKGCFWYKLPNMSTAIDTASGLWVKPLVTTTYVVKQILDCSVLKWDTVVVFIDAVGFSKLQLQSQNFQLFPNPANDILNIKLNASNQNEIKIFITNSLGEIIKDFEVQIISNSCTIKLDNLENGIYQIHLKTQNGIIAKKFVKQAQL